MKTWARIAALSLAASIVVTAPAAATVISLFGPYGGLATTYASAGYTTNVLSAQFSAADIALSRLVVANDANLTADNISTLTTYVRNGGRLVVEGEPNTATKINAVTAAMGSSILQDTTGYDANFHDTTLIATDPFTAGVSSINYAYTAGLTGGTALITGVSGQTIAAYQAIGSGMLFVISDTNLTTNVTKTTTNDNAKLFNNFVAADAAASVPEPATWAMMIGGFGMIGATMRRQRKVAVRFS